MTLTPTQWAVVAVAVVDTLAALPGWRAPTDTTGGTTVYLGPEVDTYGDPAGRYVVVGWPGDDSGAGAAQAGTLTQKAAAMASHHPRDEAGEITCMAVYQDGAPNYRGVLLGAAALLGEVQAALRLNPNLGLPDPVVRGVTFDAGSPTLQRLSGAVCLWEFRIGYTARLGLT